MKRSLRFSVILATVLGLGLVLTGPANAATLHLYLTNSTPLAPDASVGMIGTGCAASAPVSLDVWNTADPGSHVQANSIATAGSGGAWGYSYDMNNQWDPGAEIGFAFSCTATFDWTQANDPLADHSYVETTDPNPHVSIETQATSTYGTSVQVVATTEVANGNIALTVDGVAVPLDTVDENGDNGTDVSHIGWWLFHLPARLAAGTHALHATWTPQASGSPTVTDDKSLRVLKIHPTLGLRLSPARIARGSTTAAKVTLGHTGAAPRTGVVVLKKNGHEIARGRLRAADNGMRIFAVTIRAVGTYHLVAVFLGSSTLTRATSPTRTLTVHR